jgi:very-short-patch-repair endonuclease
VPEPARPTALRGRVFRGRDAVAVGLVTRKQLSSRAWRRLFRDVYVDATLPETHGVAVAGAALIVPRTAVFAGRSAAYLLGAESLVDAVTPVEVVVPDADRFGPVSGLRIRRASLPSSDVRSVSRYRCTTPVRTALDLACLEPMPDSVIALDVLLGRGLVHPDDLADRAAALPSGRGIRLARRSIALADGRAESPPETVLRILLRTAGLTPVPQYVVRTPDGRFIARVDLAFPEQRVAIEYDGAWHGKPGQLARDRRRLNALVAAGWTVLHITAADMHEPGEVVHAVRELLGGADRGVVDLARASGRSLPPRSMQPGRRSTGRARRS